MTDGALGGSSFYSNWLGFVDDDMDVIVDLEEERFINSITTSFLQVTNHIYIIRVTLDIVVGSLWLSPGNFQSAGSILTNDTLAERGVHGLQPYRSF